MKKIILLISLVSLLFISCENSLSKIENPSLVETSTNTTAVTTRPSEDGKTYITFGDISFENESRTINPVYNRDDLTALYIKGMETNKVTPTTKPTDYTTLFGLYNPKATSYEDLCTKTFEITPGVWNFILYATLYDFDFSGMTTVEVKPGMTHALNFTLATTNTSSYPYGIIDITVDFTGNADRVVATLKEKSTSTTVRITKTYTPTDTKNPISTVEGETYKRINFKTANTSSSSSGGVTAGKYYLLFEFFQDGFDEPINTVENIVRVENNFTTKKTLNLDLDELYTITYSYWEGTAGFDTTELESLTFDPATTVLPSVYSRKSETFSLPTPSLPGYDFDAWYKDTDFTEENKITQITQGSTGNLELYANFVAQGSGGSGHSPNLDDFSLVSGAIISTDLANSGFSSCSEEPIKIRDLYVCTHEVTQAEYTEYCSYGGTAPNDGDSYPVYNVSWYDAIVYCNLRSLDESLMPVYSIGNKTNPSQWPGIGGSGGKPCGPNSSQSQWEWVNSYPSYDSIVVNNDANGYRLPTAIEWEYFARGGNGLPTAVASLPNSGCSDEDLRNYAHVDSYNEIESSVYPVKDKDSNTLGLYDLCGNVKEICFDVQSEGDYRTTFDGYNIQNGYGSIESYTRDSSTGFRVVRNVHNSVDFGTGVKWATTNVGAETIADYGAYYAWGETDTRYNEVYRSNKVISWKTGYTNGYSWTGYEDGTDGADFTKYTNDEGNNVLSSTDDVATQKRGAKWRMPTPEECQALLDACYMEFTDNYNGSKIPGVVLYKAKDSHDAGQNTIKDSTFEPAASYNYSDTHLFFPAAGYFTSATDSDCGLNSFKSDVLIWTNTIWENYTTGDTARMVPLKSGAGYTDSIDDAPRYYGFSVRPVYIGD